MRSITSCTQKRTELVHKVPPVIHLLMGSGYYCKVGTHQDRCAQAKFGTHQSSLAAYWRSARLQQTEHNFHPHVLAPDNRRSPSVTLSPAPPSSLQPAHAFSHTPRTTHRTIPTPPPTPAHTHTNSSNSASKHRPTRCAALWSLQHRPTPRISPMRRPMQSPGAGHNPRKCSNSHGILTNSGKSSSCCTVSSGSRIWMVRSSSSSGPGQWTPASLPGACGCLRCTMVYGRTAGSGASPAKDQAVGSLRWLRVADCRCSGGVETSMGLALGLEGQAGVHMPLI